MRITNRVKKILRDYSGENAGTKAKLCQILMHGRLAGTGKLVILPVDQGFEHGPAKSFRANEEAYNPEYHFKLAIEGGFSAYAAPLGFLEAAIDKYIGQIPTILKLNSNNSLSPKSEQPDQAITASVRDALRLGCAAVGLTIYPGSGKALSMMEEAREVIREAKYYGLATVIWSYPRGGDLSGQDETSLDVVAYGVHIAALLGANLIKAKIPTADVRPQNAEFYKGGDLQHLSQRISHIMKSCFDGKRLVVFSGGEAKSSKEILQQVKEIAIGGSSGSIIGRNSFQRPYDEAVDLVKTICQTYKTA